MSKQDRGQYIQKVEAMFGRVTGHYEEIAREFIAAAAEMLVQTTPGPNLQYPLTEYIAVGRLRAGWHFGTQAPTTVSKVDGGPYDEEGIRTIANLRLAIFVTPIQRISFLWNDVGYGYYVHYGLENHEHIGPRPWVYDVSKLGEELLEIAMERAGSPA